MPRVSVIISTFNGQRYIREAVQSILDQTFQQVELIVVNDGSTDATLNILRAFDDRRITIVNNPGNLGIAASQNNALSVATGEYLALMDHDDISLPDRLQMQVDFLDAHPEVGMLGCNCISVDENDNVQSVSSHFSDDAFLRWQLLLCGCPFFHTSLMVRRSEMERIGGYDGSYLFAGDYHVISKLTECCGVANLDQPLVKWRVHRSSVSSINRQQLSDEAFEIARRNIQAIMRNNKLDDYTWAAMRTLVMNDPAADVNISGDQVHTGILFLLTLQNSFYEKHSFSDAVRRRHRRHLYRLWGKHFLALACRRNGRRDAKCRSTLLLWSARLLLGGLSATQIQSATPVNPIANVSTQQPL